MEKQPRPKKMFGKTVKMSTGCGSLYVTVNVNGNAIFEVLGILGKTGGCAKAQTEAITRCVSLGLRYGVPIEEFIKGLAGISCPESIWDEGEQVLSCPDAISKAIKLCEIKEVNSEPH